eukprot:CAMPEP_0197648740 /NCGR_PEP_ID=MMETSP1338-20131121/27935_1 /TAXON_ID=43686 ORGANISM="Pelagodinium beii, Strain RCC1491" /NCGR_SAMPLE_ID=MMETSP1338 /ASSEMBLY_ACC=CAM_ASM_000754 /LENGTH=147 /DNA_ID=CAMNT_0043222793 /DNA_START=40 /DNA_END=481 /DNA_ORIENTATION=-
MAWRHLATLLVLGVLQASASSKTGNTQRNLVIGPDGESSDFTGKQKINLIRKEGRTDCSQRQPSPECPHRFLGQDVCESKKVFAGDQQYSPCKWHPEDVQKQTPASCIVDTYDPCYTEDPYDPGRGPGKWPAHDDRHVSAEKEVFAQ